MDATDVLLLTVGLVIVVATLADVVATLVATAGSGLRWRLTHQFYRWTWALWSRASRRVRSPARR